MKIFCSVFVMCCQIPPKIKISRTPLLLISINFYIVSVSLVKSNCQKFIIIEKDGLIFFSLKFNNRFTYVLQFSVQCFLFEGVYQLFLTPKCLFVSLKCILEKF